MDPIRGSRFRGRGCGLRCGAADHAAQIRCRQAWEQVRLRREAYLARHARSAAFLNAHRGGKGGAESSAAAARGAANVAARDAGAVLVEYSHSDKDEEMAGEVAAALVAGVDAGPIIGEISDDEDMAVTEEEQPEAAMVDDAEPEAAVVDAAKPPWEPEEAVLECVLACSVCMALREQVRRHHVAAYNAEQLEAGILSFEQFEANRHWWRVDALLQAYMEDSSDEE